MIEIIPSISVYQGKCVKVPPGDFENPIVYGDSPMEVAQAFEDNGIRRIHLIDLDGAKKGSVVNHNVLQMIAGYTNLSIDFTGGIHTKADAQMAFDNGAKFVTAASVAATKRDFFATWIGHFGREKIVLAADALRGKIVTDGWRKSTGIDLFEQIAFYYEKGIKCVKCTDVGRDGTLEGPSIGLYKQILTDFPGICLLASGGVRNTKDIHKLAEIGVFGVIFGKAYYEGKIKLRDLRDYLG
jgi:phosphoribosylformimino-5-aminoimidazole carboxamide ribotide isomerase